MSVRCTYIYLPISASVPFAWVFGFGAIDIRSYSYSVYWSYYVVVQIKKFEQNKQAGEHEHQQLWKKRKNEKKKKEEELEPN